MMYSYGIAVVYLIIAAIYVGLEGEIYPLMTFDHWLTYITVILMLILILVSYVVGKSLKRRRTSKSNN